MGKARKKRYNPQKILRIGGDALVGWRALALLVMDDAMWEGYYLHNRGGGCHGRKAEGGGQEILSSAPGGNTGKE